MDQLMNNSKSNDQNNTNIINFLNQQHENIKREKPQTPITIEILDDLSSRFIINIPNEERDIIRVLFQIELAYWFYVDFVIIEKPDLIKYNFKPFAKLMFNHVPFLRQYLTNFDQVIDEWRGYKHNVPTYGAIILDESMENVLMVQGYWSNSTWGFPKGKVNAEEDAVVCACREVKEEIGYDCTDRIEKNEFIEMYIRDTYIRLYIITGVSKDEQFVPLTRNEIKSIQWFPIKNLPANRYEKELNPNAFFMVIPIIRTLKRWIYERRKLKNKSNHIFSSFPTLRNNYNSSPVSKHYSTKNMTHQQFNNHSNSNRNRLFSNGDKITILKNKSKGSLSSKFWSESLTNFKLNLDDLWKVSMKVR